MKETKENIIRSFEEAYIGIPAWEIGRPQPELIRWEMAGEIHGTVLDVGCGSGENALYLAKKNYQVVGIDLAANAISMARQKARERNLSAPFLMHDALELGKLGIKFDTIVDSGLFHVYSDDARMKFVESLRSALRTGGKYLMICFSEDEPPGWGPRRITREEIYRSFANGFRIDYIVPAFFETLKSTNKISAWSTAMKKI